jgi:hypothetical protein
MTWVFAAMSCNACLFGCQSGKSTSTTVIKLRKELILGSTQIADRMKIELHGKGPVAWP